MSRTPSPALRRVFLAAALAVACALTLPARAQQTEDEPPPLPSMPLADPTPHGPEAGARAPAEAAPPPAPAAAILPAERVNSLATHWALRRDYLRDRDERRAQEEEQRVRELRKDLGLENLFVIGASLVRESFDALAAGSAAEAKARCAFAVELAPALPDAHFCLARATLTKEPLALAAATSELLSGLRAAQQDPRLRREVATNAAALVLGGLFVGGLLFLALLALRHAALYVHDVHHLFPAGVRRWQSGVLAVLLLLLPLLLRLGPVPLLVTALAACAIYASSAEVLAACAVLALIAAAPPLAGAVSRLGDFGGPAGDVYALERGEGSSLAQARLQRRLEARGPEFPVAFALARKAKREGDLATARALFGRALEVTAPPEALGAAHNDLGNVLLLAGDAPGAAAEYRKAIDLRDDLAAAHFNLGRALAFLSPDQLLKAQEEQERALDLDRRGIEAFTEGAPRPNRKANRLVLDTQLPESAARTLETSDAALSSGVADEVAAALSGPLPPRLALLWPALAAAALLALHAARKMLRPSARCERCGREVCSRCDPEARAAEALCGQCVNVFVVRDGLDPAERIRKELAVQFYRRRRTTTVRLLNVISGAGHVWLGHPLRGLLYLALMSTLAASVLFFGGVARSPLAVRSGISLLRVGATAACLLAVWALCLRDLSARQRAEAG